MLPCIEEHTQKGPSSQLPTF